MDQFGVDLLGSPPLIASILYRLGEADCTRAPLPDPTGWLPVDDPRAMRMLLKALSFRRN